MNDANDLNGEFSPADPHRDQNGHGRQERNGSAHSTNGRSHSVAKYDPRNRREPAARPIDGWFILETLLPRWHWVVVSCAILGFIGWATGMLAWKKTYTATAQLLRFEPLAAGDFFKPQPVSQDTFGAMLKAPELMQEVGTNLEPPLNVEIMNKCVLIKYDSESDIVKVMVKAYDPMYAVNLANLYAKSAVSYTRELQRRDAEEINRAYISNRVEKMDEDIKALEKQFRALPQSSMLTAQLGLLSGTVTNITKQLAANVPTSALAGARMTERLQSALDELANLTRKYTDEHPAVQQQKAVIAAIEKEIRSNTNGVPALGGGTGPMQLFNPDYEIIHTKLNALSQSRQLLADRQQEAKAFIADPPGNVRFFAPATFKGITPDHRWLKVGILTIVGLVLGLLFSLGAVFIVEFMDNRLKTADDVQRVTKLPIIASLEDLDGKSPSEREQWAFRTWTMLQGRLSPSPNHGLVCGITSSTRGEGRSTWINLLADAASLSGFRVLTIATRPANGEGTLPHELSNRKPGDPETDEMDSTALALTSNALTCPSEVTQQLTGPNARPSVHIPLPGWVWNLERRKQWQEALKHWRTVENLVILVELPPSSSPEAVLLGENLPNMVWLTSSGKADAAQTRLQLETLRHARCNLVGAVLNKEPGTPLKNRFPRWIGCIALGFFCLTAFGTGCAQQKQPVYAPVQSGAVSGVNLFASNTVPATNVLIAANNADPANAAATSTESSSNAVANTNAVATDATQKTDTNAYNGLLPASEAATNQVEPLSFSITTPPHSEWQKHFTLGAGDILSISLYGQTDLTRPDVLIAPDGRISFLEAQNVMAAGLTIDELRTNLDQELGKYRRAPRTIISPVTLRSKHYFMLGRVVLKGVFVMDRPITVLEAVARAHGLESGVSGRTSIELADFQHAFLMRHGKRYPLNFEDLFVRGNLAENIAIEPDDYLYFPSAKVREVYVLGEVRIPGPVPYTEDMNVISAIAQRGGYTDYAYKTHVLVVRGSFSRPKGYVVNTEDILYGRGTNFHLQPGDIVFVSGRPLLRMEQLLDMAVSAYLQSVTTEWTGKLMGIGVSQ